MPLWRVEILLGKGVEIELARMTTPDRNRVTDQDFLAFTRVSVPCGGYFLARALLEGKISAVRWFQLLLISLLFAGQVHLCQASYRLPSGRECGVCPTP
jgi:hypothetical protein